MAKEGYLVLYNGSNGFLVDFFHCVEDLLNALNPPLGETVTAWGVSSDECNF